MSLANDRIEEWYQRYGPMVLRRCRRLLGSEEHAQEATQEVFLKLLKTTATLHDQAPSSLLYRIATNHCLNQIRNVKRRPETPDQPVIDRILSEENLWDRVSAARLVQQALRKQPASTTYIATLHFVDGMTLAEVAEEVGMSVSGVRKRLRTLKSLAQKIEQQPRGLL